MANAWPGVYQEDEGGSKGNGERAAGIAGFCLVFGKNGVEIGNWKKTTFDVLPHQIIRAFAVCPAWQGLASAQCSAHGPSYQVISGPCKLRAVEKAN